MKELRQKPLRMRMQQRIRAFSLLIGVVAITVSCSNTPPFLESRKALTYSFQQPNRTVISADQSKHLSTPHLKPSGIYSSANGHQCRQLSARRTVCYIGGKWLESVAIRGKKS